VPELSRASVKDTPANEPLFTQLAKLCGEVMHDIRDLGLLSREFLGVLPNDQDALGEKYKRMRQSIIDAFNEQPLMPTFDKGYAPAKDLYQAKASLKELLSSDDIEFLIEYEDAPPQWAANRDLQGTPTERFMTALAINDWDVDDFLGEIIERAGGSWREQDADFMAWLAPKPAEWFQRMYAMLAREPETADELYLLSDTPIVKLVDGTFSAPDKCYFPDEQRRYKNIVPCVDPEILEAGNSQVRKKAARKFLEEVGVSEIGERQLVEALLKKEYSSDDHPLKESDYIAHLRRFLKLATDEPSATDMLAKFRLFVGADGKWHSAKEIYLDRPFADTGLSEFYNIVGLPKGLTGLADFYANLPIDTPKLVRFVESLGARRCLQISRTTCQKNPSREYLIGVPGSRWTDYSINSDFRFDNFGHLVAARSMAMSKLVWNSLIDQIGEGADYLKARYRINLSGGSRYADSQLVHQLRQAEWIPQGERFVRPSSARAELLPDGFTFDPGWAWIKAIKFGSAVELENEKAKAEQQAEVERANRKQAAAVELGFEGEDDLTFLEKLRELPLEARPRLLSELARIVELVELPDQEPRNPDRRATRVGELAANALERKSEERTRSVSVGRDEVKAETAQYLQQQYTKDDDVFCQICKKPMPFKLDDGSVYFEKVEFLAELSRRHHQNYLALCPNHAAMFRFANGSKELMREMFQDLSGNELEVVLAQQNMTVYFTKTHIADLKKVIEVDQNSTDGDIGDEQ
jgi:hypothetical protein